MGLLKHTSPVKAVDDTVCVVDDFTRQTPFWSYRPVAYRPYAPLVGLQPKLDAHLDALFDGEIDDGNGDVLDNLIFDYARQAYDDLVSQQVTHRDSIKSFSIQAQAARKAFELQLSRLKTTREEVNEEYNALASLYRKDKFGGDSK